MTPALALFILCGLLTVPAAIVLICIMPMGDDWGDES